tara:strand:- start:542 stop:874 length:333 start_codon:yes stop_codon:yes gene_type:complete
MNGSDKAPDIQFYRGDGDGMTGHGIFEPELEATYHLKARCTTEDDSNDGKGVTRYQLKIWEMDTEEPATWSYEERQESATALRTGGVALVAHHIDVTFGNVVVYDHTEHV